MKYVFLIAAIVGAVVPYIFFLDFFGENGMALGTFIDAAFVNGAAAGATADLLISSAVFWIYMFTRKGGPQPWLFILINLFIGLSCAVPLYLYVTYGKNENQATA